MIGIIWIPDEPVPITPTRRRAKSTLSFGQRPLWYQLPLKVDNPGKAGTRGKERLPVAMTQNGAFRTSPLAVSTSQRLVSLSKTADMTRVSVWMKGRRPNRSAT